MNEKTNTNVALGVDVGKETIVHIPNRAERRQRYAKGARQSHMDINTVRALLPAAGKLNFSAITKPQRGDVKHGEPYSQAGPLTKPYAIINWQKKIDKREAKIRTLPHGDPKRAKIAEEVRAMKKRIGQ